MIDWNIFYSFIKILKYQRKSSLVIEKLSQYKADFMAGCELASGWQDSSLCGDDVERLRLLWLGRKGKIPELFSSLRAVAKEDKARFGKELNDLKHFIESELLKLNALVEQRAVCDVISSQREDITLPVAAVSARGGGLHPISLISERLLAVFRSLGYIVHEGPELENDFYNFSALNVPKDHPARDMQDTFYVGDRGSVSSGESPSWVLRTQTSNIQIHALKDQSPPLRIVSAGRVFRMDNDPTHSPMFHQIEGWNYIDSFYFTGITITTIGYGDLVPTHDGSKIVASLYAIVCIPITLFAFGIIAEEYIETRMQRLENTMSGLIHHETKEIEEVDQKLKVKDQDQ